jgi:hypothetical protein
LAFEQSSWWLAVDRGYPKGAQQRTQREGTLMLFSTHEAIGLGILAGSTENSRDVALICTHKARALLPATEQLAPCECSHCILHNLGHSHACRREIFIKQIFSSEEEDMNWELKLKHRTEESLCHF